MPVTCAKRGDMFRIVEAANGQISMTPKGNPKDGGGHRTKEMCAAQARAINAGIAKKAHESMHSDMDRS